MAEESAKKRLMIAILHHLRGELRAGRLDSEQTEGLEVAIQCLESIYGVHKALQIEPPLLDVYQSFLTLSVISKPDASPEAKAAAEKLKTEGNMAMNKGLFNDAIALYTRAISHDAKNAVYYCNRAAAHSKLRNHQQAIVDCKVAIEIDPTYSKAHGRLGLAFCGLDDYPNALLHYKRAVDLEPTNDGYKQNYELARSKVSENHHENTPESGTSSSTGSSRNTPNVSNAPPPNPMDFAGIFNNPQLLNIASHMLTDPQLQNMMASFMNEGAPAPPTSSNQPNENAQPHASNFGDLLMIGQRLAQRMQQENPQFIDELRNTLGSGDRTNPSSNPSGHSSTHHEKEE